jgi:hypothetical protein
MAYCAISARTESGDDYVFLIEHRTPSDITQRILEDLGEEAGYIYTYGVDTGISSEEDDAVEKAIQDAIDQSQNNIEEEE